MFLFRSLFTLVLAALFSANLMAADVPEKQAIIAKLEGTLPKMKVESLEPTPIKGLYQLETTSGELLLVSADGNYIISGDLHQLGDHGITNLTEKRRGSQRKEAMADLKDKDMVIFQAKGEQKGEVIVFTDTSCAYCRKFHSEVPQLNNMGITVKYVAWPRYGLQSPAGQTMVNVWCAKDRQDALTKAKSNEQVAAPAGVQCDQNVIQNEINLGFKMGVQGTPAVFLTDGRQVGGYVPAAQLAAQLGIK